MRCLKTEWLMMRNFNSGREGVEKTLIPTILILFSKKNIFLTWRTNHE